MILMFHQAETPIEASSHAVALAVSAKHLLRWIPGSKLEGHFSPLKDPQEDLAVGFCSRQQDYIIVTIHI